MTLVVAERLLWNIRIFADMKITDPSEVLKGLENAVLKAVIVRPDICIMFAGKINHAQMALEHVYEHLIDGSVDAIGRYLVSAHRESQGETDFILASFGGDTRLDVVRCGAIEQNLSHAWIGNQAAYSTFQEFRSKMKPIPLGHDADAERIANSIMSMKRSMEQVIDRHLYPDVGGFCVEIGTASDGFYYEPRYVGFPGNSAIFREESGDLSKAFQASGSFGFDLLSPRKVGIGAIGLYFGIGRLGYFFYPREQVKPLMYSNVSIYEFISEVKRGYNIDLQATGED